MSFANQLVQEGLKTAVMFPAALPSTAVVPYFDTKNYSHVLVSILVNNATTVTGSAVGVTQATTATGTGVKAVPLQSLWRNLDTAASAAQTQVTVVSNTFTTLTTNSKSAIYQFTVATASDQSSDAYMDNDGGFRFLSVTLGDAAATVITVTFQGVPARYQSVLSDNPLV